MRPALRDDIVETARKLFNESSYGSVSMRDISEALHISVGNLTYYFRKKQDILRAIMEKNFRNTAVTEQVHTFRQFNELLRKDAGIFVGQRLLFSRSFRLWAERGRKPGCERAL